MGIEFDREVSAVVHLGFPPSADDYQQEIGRGGRRGGRCDCLLYASLPMAHRTVALLARRREGEVRASVTRRLERFQELLFVLFSEGCRRDALLTATLGPELACQCAVCDTCDRCSSDSTCCEMTAGSEEEHDLRDAARAQWGRLVRRPHHAAGHGSRGSDHIGSNSGKKKRLSHRQGTITAIPKDNLRFLSRHLHMYYIICTVYCTLYTYKVSI